MKKNNLSIQIDTDTSALQLKLRAIAKHTAALADELDEIDQEQCPKCGSREVEIVKAYGYGGKVEAIAVSRCFTCNPGSDE